MALASSISVAWIVVGLTAVVVINDGVKLKRAADLVPKLGLLSGGGWAWESDSSREVIRNASSLLALGIMMALPWALVETSATPRSAVFVFDVLLAMHCGWLMLPKRYAITSTHLFADGFEHPWDSLKSTTWSGGSRIVLHRRGWWVFAPLPLGGDISDLEQAAARIEALGSDEWHLFDAIMSEE